MRAAAVALAGTLAAVQRAERRLAASPGGAFRPTLLFLKPSCLIGTASGESSSMRQKEVRWDQATRRSCGDVTRAEDSIADQQAYPLLASRSSFSISTAAAGT